MFTSQLSLYFTSWASMVIGRPEASTDLLSPSACLSAGFLGEPKDYKLLCSSLLVSPLQLIIFDHDKFIKFLNTQKHTQKNAITHRWEMVTSTFVFTIYQCVHLNRCSRISCCTFWIYATTKVNRIAQWLPGVEVDTLLASRTFSSICCSWQFLAWIVSLSLCIFTLQYMRLQTMELILISYQGTVFLLVYQ